MNEEVENLLEGWGIKGGLKYDDEGNLALEGKLGESVAWGDMWEFEYSLKQGQSVDEDEPLTYQDMADYSAFQGQFKILGEFLANRNESFHRGQEMVRVIQRIDGATFGKFYWQEGGKYGEANMEYDDHDEATDRSVWLFKPVEPFTITGYGEVK